MVLFMHIERTAGTSIGRLLKHACHCVELHNEAWQDVRQLAAIRQNAHHVDCVRGHFPYGLHEALGVESDYITVLRHPVPRAASHFAHARHTGTWSGSLHDFLVHPRYRNLVVQRLAGAQNLALAWKRLQSFAVVGFTECLEAFREALARRYGWQMPPLERHNVSGAGQALDERTRAAIEATQALDTELYTRAWQWQRTC